VIGFFLPALNSGAVSEEEVLLTVFTLEDILGRSLNKIL
jgi:hypothetical protein